MREWVLLRGLVRESAHWMGFDRLLKKMFPNDNVICLDLPGSGIFYEKTSPMRVSEYVDFLEQKISKKTNQRNLIGISFGGMIAIEWLSRSPQTFHKAFIINSSFSGLSPFYRRLRPKNYFTIMNLFLKNDLYHREKKIFDMTVNLCSEKEKVIQRWIEVQKSHPISKRSSFHQLLASSRYQLPREKPEVPIVILNTLSDRLVHPSCSDLFANKWDLKKYTHPSAGHDLSLDAPEWLLECIKKEL